MHKQSGSLMPIYYEAICDRYKDLMSDHFHLRKFSTSFLLAGPLQDLQIEIIYLDHSYPNNFVKYRLFKGSPIWEMLSCPPPVWACLHMSAIWYERIITTFPTTIFEKGDEEKEIS